MNSIIILFIIILNGIAKQTNCFELNNDNIDFNYYKTTLIINGTGLMCNCYNNELDNYRMSITTLIIQNTVTSIGNKCFMNFEKLTSIQFGEGITTIGKYAFYNTKITSLTIPKSVKRIMSHAFQINLEFLMIL